MKYQPSLVLLTARHIQAARIRTEFGNMKTQQNKKRKLKRTYHYLIIFMSF